MDTSPKYALETLAVRAGQERSQFNEHSEALYLTSSFVFTTAAQAAARFSGEEEGNVYSRFTNPTVSAFQHRLAAHVDERLGLCATKRTATRRDDPGFDLRDGLRSLDLGHDVSQLLRVLQAWERPRVMRTVGCC